MARAVGTIEVTVDANTGRLKAQVVKGARTAGQAGAEVLSSELADIDTAELTSRLKVIKAKIESEFRNIEIDLGVDDGEVQAAIKRIQAQIRAIQAEIELELEDGEFKAELQSDLAAARLLLQELRANVDVDLDVSESEIAAAQELIDDLLRDVQVKVEPEIDNGAAAIFLAKWKALMAQAGEEGGAEANKGMDKSFFSKMLSGDNTKLIIAGIVALGGEAVAALEGLVSAATAVISSAVFALGAGIGALTPIVAGLGAAVAGGITGFLGFGDAMGAVNEEMARSVATGTAFNANAVGIQASLRGLSDNARATAEAFAAMRPQMDALQRGIQESLFADFDGTMRVLASETLPDVAGSLDEAASSVNEFGLQLAGVAANTDFAGMFDAVKPAVDAVFDAITLVIAAFEPFIQAAAPAADRLGGFLAVMASNLRDFVGNNPDAIAKFLDDGLDSLKQWGGLLVSVSKLLGTIFKAGKQQGDTFVGTLTDITDGWNDWLKSVEGQTALVDFFNTGRDAIGALKPVLDGLKEAFTTLMDGGGLERFEVFAQAVGDVLPILAELINLIGNTGILSVFLGVIVEIGQALEPVTPELQELAVAIGELLATALEAVVPLLEGAAAVIGALAVVLTPLISGLAELNPTLLLILAAVIPLAVGIGVLTVTMGGLSGAFVAVGVSALSAAAAIGVFIATNPFLLALAGTIALVAAGAALLTGQFGSAADKQKAMEERTAEVTDSLVDQVDVMLQAAAAGEKVDDALTVMSNALLASAEDGDKLRDSMGELGIQFDDASETLIDIGKNPVKAMAALAEAMGYTEEQSLQLAEAVNATDDNFKSLHANDGRNRAMFDELAEATGRSTESLLADARALEELQDQREDLDVTAMVTGFIQAEAALGENNAAIVEAILKGRDLADMTEDQLVTAYQQLTSALADNAAEGGTAAESAAQVQAGLEEEAEAARLATAEADALAEGMRNAAREMAIAESGAPLAARAVADLADELGIGAEKADSMTDAFKSLVSPFLDSQAAFDAMIESASELSESLNKTGDEVDGSAFSLDALTEAGRENREQIRDHVAGILEWAAAEVAAGGATEGVENAVLSQRNALIDQMVAFGMTREAATEYVDSLGLTPDVITTTIDTPGMEEALINSADLNVEFDEAGNPVITDFKQPGLEAGITDTGKLNDEIGDVPGQTTAAIDVNAPEQTDNIKETKGALDDVDETDPAPRITLPTQPTVTRQLKEIQKALDDIDDTNPTPRITMPTYTGIKNNLDDILDLLEDIDDDVSVTISLPGINQRISEVDRLKRSIDSLYSRTITLTTRNVTQNVGGSMAGSIVAGDQLMRVGERGLAEAIVPLQLPLNRVDPSVRDMAAILRGQGVGGAAQGGGATHNHTWNITEAGDARTTAHKVINRMVAFV